MKLNKTAIAIALSSVLGIATIGGVHAQAGASSGGASAGTSAGTSGQTGSNSNSMTNPGARSDAMGNGSMSSMHGANGSTTNNGRYHWWQKEWWQQHAENGRVTRQQYMDQMGRRWDSMDTNKQGYLTPDQLERAFGDETTVAPGGNGRESANPAAGPGGGMTRGSATTSGTTRQ